MIRKAFRMSVKPDKFEEYKRRHNPIWPELEKKLKEHGAHNYSIFLDPTDGSLFAYLEIEDEARWASIAKTEICQKWWKAMSDIMSSNPDHSPKAVGLEEAFYLR